MAVVELVWQDETGSTAVTTLRAPSSLTYDEIDAGAIALASILIPLTDCVLIEQRVRYISVQETPATASGGASVLRTGVFFFSTSFDTPLALVVVRAVKDEFISTEEPGAGVAIDTSSAEVLAFNAAIIDNGLTNIFGDDITAFETAYLQSRV